MICEERLTEAVSEKMHVPGSRINLRMCGKCRLEFPSEIVWPDRAQIARIDFKRNSDFARAQKFAAMPDNRNIALGRRAARSAACAKARAAVVERRMDIAIPIPTGIASIKANTVQHPVTEKPMR